MNVFQRVSVGRRGAMAACAAALAVAGFASTASAHGGPFRAFQILNAPSDPAVFVASSDNWGFIYSRDGARTWQWSCAEPYGGYTLQVGYASMTFVDRGRLLVANGFQGVSYTDTFCDWSKATGMDGLLVVDTKSLGGRNVLAMTSTGLDDRVTIENRVYESNDNGASFTRVDATPPLNLVIQSFAIAPSDPQVVYALGQIVDSNAGVILRSGDGGRTFTRHDAPTKAEAPRVTLRIAGIHPTNPNVLFEWLDVPEGLGETEPDSLKFTTDGGQSWRMLFDGKGDLPGFAISPDSRTLAFSGPVDGVYTGDLEDVVAADKGSTALSRVNSRSVWGLLWNGSGLYGGNDNFSARGTPETFTIGLSQNQGGSFTEVTDICQVQYPTCAAGSQVRDQCDALWEDKSLGGFKQDFWVNSGRCPDQKDVSSDGGGSGVGGAGSAGGHSDMGDMGDSSTATGGAPSAGGAESASNGPDGGSGPPTRDALRVDAGCTVHASHSDVPSRAPFAVAASALALALARRMRRA